MMITQAIGLGLAAALAFVSAPSVVDAVDSVKDLYSDYEQGILISDVSAIGAAVLESVLLSDDGETYPAALTVSAGRIAELPSIRLGSVGRLVTYAHEGERVRVQVCKENGTACALFDSSASSIAVYEDGEWRAL